MNKFLNTHAGHVRKTFRGIFVKPKGGETIKPAASTESELKAQEGSASKNFTSKLLGSFRPNSRVGSTEKNESPIFVPNHHSQPVEQPDDKTECNQKSSRLSYLKAQLNKYACSFKSRIYNGQNQSLMSEAEEAKAAKFAIELFICLTLFLAPALREFLASKKLHPRNSTVDVYEYLKKLKKICKGNINFLSSGGSNGLDLQYVETAHTGRNSVCHGVLPVVLAEWHTFLHSWIQLCYLINAPEAAKKIEMVHDRLIAEEKNNPENQLIPAKVSTENFPETDPQQQDDKSDEPETLGKV